MRVGHALGTYNHNTDEITIYQREIKDNYTLRNVVKHEWCHRVQWQEDPVLMQQVHADYLDRLDLTILLGTLLNQLCPVEIEARTFEHADTRWDSSYRQRVTATCLRTLFDKGLEAFLSIVDITFDCLWLAQKYDNLKARLFQILEAQPLSSQKQLDSLGIHL